MANRPKLQAQKRTKQGRKVKQLRKEGVLPANIFGKKIKSQSIQLDLLEFSKMFDQVGETNLIDLIVNKHTNPVLISNIQSDPVTGKPIHVDFHQVDLTQKVTASVPLEFIGTSSDIQEQGLLLTTPLSELEVEALPDDLIDKIEIDLSGLKTVGDTITVSDLKISTKVEVQADPETVLVVVQEPKEEEIQEPETTEAEGAEDEQTKQDNTPETTPEEKESKDQNEKPDNN